MQRSKPSSNASPTKSSSRSTGPDPKLRSGGLNHPARVLSLAQAQCAQLGLPGQLLVAAPDGACVSPAFRRPDPPHLTATRRRAIEEAFRWGEPVLLWQDDTRVLLAVALSLNQELSGALIVQDIPIPESPEAAALQHLNAAAWNLQLALEQANLLNAALMAARRERGREQREQAEALHESKLEDAAKLRQGFLRLEPELLLAVRRGDRSEARRLLNSLLLYLYNLGRNEFLRVRELIADLVGQMRHAVSACGVDPAAHPVLAAPVWERLSRMTDEEELGPWLHQTLEELISALNSSAVRPARLRARLVLDFIHEHLARPLTRDHVAAKAGLSPAEFSRMLRRETGRTFSQHLRAIRIDQACQLLRASPYTIQQIGSECGYNDQAHFSRVFKSETGKSPGAFRAANSHNTSKESHKPSKTDRRFSVF